MDLYASVAYELSEKLTKKYSTSFSLSSKLFPKAMRQHIYAIYGLVRIADEIVDTYQGADAEHRLLDLHTEVQAALKTGYSTNPIVHSFICTAQQYSIDKQLIDPFFQSMKMDLSKKSFTQNEYEDYIHGSAEVIGLMCLKVFVEGDQKEYERLKSGAQSLGAAYQKVNFLRDIKADYEERGRVYFPHISFETFSNEQKQEIIQDIEKSFVIAHNAISQLPPSSRRAVRASYLYYTELLQKLKRASASTLKEERIRVSDNKKLLLLARAII